MSISSSSIVLNLVPVSSTGTFSKSSNLDISVTLSGTGGYYLGIYSATSGANTTSLVNTSDSTQAFTSITSAVSESDFSSASNTQYNNKWGYLPSKYNSSNNTSFRPAPNENGDVLDQTSGTDDTGTYTLSIGARADLDTTTGSYAGTYVITAIANQACNPLATTIGDALCMQDISGDNPNADAVINSMEEGRQYKLKDNRDWKTYYVAKMKDGRVWMTQNLDLDLETTPNNVAALTHANTDLGWSTLDTTATWTPRTATVTTASGYGTNTNTAPASFDSGDTYRYVSTTGTTTSYTTKSACENAHPDGTCAHYHVGNYYNWSAAVASNNTSAITANYTTAPNSICPAGWRLPAGKTSNTSTNPGYYGEINYTWVNEGLAQNYVTGTGTATYNPGNSTGWINIRNNPMYMVAAGYKNSTSSVSSLGFYGYFWTNTAYSGTTAYAPYVYSSGLYPTYYSTSSTVRGRGMSIRCVARQANTGSTTITFDKNAVDATGTMSNQTYNANTLNTLPTNGFSRTGYTFNSWNTAPDGSGTSYQDAAQYYARTGTAATTVALYAQWDKVYTITFNVGAGATGIYFDGTTYTNGQSTQAIAGKEYQISGVFPTKYGLNSWNVTAGTLANSSAPTTTYTAVSNATITVTGKEATTSISSLTPPTDPVSSNCKNEAVVPQLVYDPRDNEAYYVARLCDGNIWMLDNLRLDLTNSTIINTLSSTNTNATDAQLAYLKGTSTGTTTDQYPTAGLSGSEWTSNSYSVPQAAARFKDDIAPVTFGLGSGKVGVYYNYCATSAGTYCWGNGTSETGSPTTDPNTSSYRDIEGDICPAGWHLPDFNIEFQNLLFLYSDGGTLGGQTALTGDIAHNTALSTPLSGYINSVSSRFDLGTYGYFWSSTWTNTYYMYDRNVTATSVYLGNYGSRYYGNSIRCVYGGQTTVSFDKNANDATGTMSSQTVTGGTWIKINNGFSRTGYTLNSWNTEPDGSGTSYTDIYTAPSNATGNVTLYAQWDELRTITFNIGSGATSIYFDGTTYTNGQTTQVASGTEHKISGVFPTKYGLNSWNVTAGTLANSSTPTTTYTVVSNATITVTGKEATTSISNLTPPTDPVSSNCKNEAVVPQLVYDPRDNEAYYVARLCDGNIWMLDNLRLDLTNSTIINTLSSTNTNATDAQLAYLKNGGGTTSDQYPTSGLSSSEWTSGYSYSVPRVASRFKDNVAPVTFGLGSGKVGVYYNYCATSAGTYCWGNDTIYTGSPTTDPNTSSYRDIEGDICPANWHLPNYNLEFTPLSSSYNGGGTLGGQTALDQVIAHNTALSTPMSGTIGQNGSQNNLGIQGSFWSSTWYDTYDMLHLRTDNTYIMYASSYRWYGLSIRCILGNV